MDDLRVEIEVDTAHLVRVMSGYGFIISQKDAEWAWLLYSQSRTATWLDIGPPDLVPGILLIYLQPC